MKYFKTLMLIAALIGPIVTGNMTCHAEEVQAISAPSADIGLSFITAGRISEVLVKPGDLIQKGHVLARLDDGPERIQAQQFKVQAEDRTRILAAKAELAQKKVDLNKVKLAKAKGAASDWEVEHLLLGVRIAELSLKAAIIEHEQNQRRYAQAVSQLERMRLMAPIAGRVEKVIVETGEAVKTLGPVIQIVSIDPLWIDAPVPLSVAEKLTLDQEVRVVYPGVPETESPNGKIIHISSVADAASDTLTVRVEATNPENRPAGERVVVRFSDADENDPSRHLAENL